MIVGSAPETAVARILARARSPSSAPVCSLPIATSDGAVDDPGRVAGRVDVVDLLDPVVLLQRDRVEAAHLAHRGERRLQPAERLDGRARADELVAVEHDLVVDVQHRHHRASRSGPRPARPAARSCERAA